MGNRTVRHFTSDDDVLEIVRFWALKHNFEAMEKSTYRKLYIKKNWLDAPDFYLEIQVDGNKVSLQAWMKNWMGEKSLEGGGMVGIAPRNSFKNALNDLLRMLEEPTIK